MNPQRLEDLSPRELEFQACLARGYILRTKLEGWKQFCERLNVPPYLLWECLPGYARLQRAFKMTERDAFSAEGFLRWVNAQCPDGSTELTTVPLTVQMVVENDERAFRARVGWWGGRSPY